MGRKKESCVYDYYEYNRSSNKSKCKTCSKEFTGKVVSNLKKHLLSHDNISEEVTFKDSEAKAKASKRTRSDSFVQQPIDTYVSKKKKVIIEISEQEVEEACVQLVTNDGRPFSLMDDGGFHALTEPIFQALGMRMNRQKVKTLVDNEAVKEKEKLKAVLQRKLISLKLDIATRQNRSFLGINVQYCDNYKLKICTLACQELKSRHTAEQILKTLQDVLEEFEIQKSQIYSVTTDNGSNFVKAFSEDFINSGLTNNVEIDTGSFEIDFDSCDDEIISHEDPDVLGEEVYSGYNVKFLRCAAHTLQLAVIKFAKEKENSKIIGAARKIVKALRTTNVRYVLESLGQSAPVIDCDTRWSSTHDMMESLIKLKETCGDLIEKGIIKGKITSANWNSVQELVDILKPAKEATIKFQGEQLTAGEFYEIWTRMKLDISAKNTGKSRKLFEFILQREISLMSNDAILAALYLDPRYKTLFADKIPVVREYIIGVAKRLLALQIQSEQEIVSPPVATTAGGSTEDEFENMLASGDARQGSGSARGDVEQRMLNFREELLNFEALPRTKDRKINVFKWWSDSDFSGVLQQVAWVILSIPVTQVSVERLFSALRFILNDYRGRLSEESLKNVLFIRVNKEFK